MIRTLGITGIVTFYLLVALGLAWLVGQIARMRDRVAERRDDPGTVFVTSLPPVPHPCTLPRRCPAIRDEGQCDLDADHAGTHVHVVTDDQEAVFWGAAA